MGFGSCQPGVLLSFFLVAVGRVPSLVIEILLIELVVLVALAFRLMPLLVGIRKDATAITKIELAAVALPDGFV